MNSLRDLRNAIGNELGRSEPDVDFETRMLERTRPLRSANARSSATQAVGRLGTGLEAPRVLALVASVLALVIVASLLFAAHGRKADHTIPARGVATGPAISVTDPVILNCPANCRQQALTFASANIIWAVIDSTSDGRATIYRTTDAGKNWRPLASWNKTGTASIAVGSDRLVSASADGKEVVLVATGTAGSSLINTADGGIHWASYGLPTSVELIPAPIVDFLNPREGWLVSPEDYLDSRFDDLFHTTDSGATWQLSGRVSVTTDFDLSRGSLDFVSSKEAWFVPTYRAASIIQHTLYRSNDGGLTWTSVSLVAPSVAPVQYKPGSYEPFHAAIDDVTFFNANEGVVELQGGVCNIPPSDASCGPWREGTIYAYTTLDDGNTWSQPRLVADGGIVDFIDSVNWARIEETSTATGTVFSTAFSSDGGNTWSAARSSPPGDPRSLRFVDVMDGWEWDLYCLPTVYKTVDGGVHWASLELPVALGPTCGM